MIVVGPDQHKGDRPRSQRWEVSGRVVEDELVADCQIAQHSRILRARTMTPSTRRVVRRVHISVDVDQYLSDCAVFDGPVGVGCSCEREPV